LLKEVRFAVGAEGEKRVNVRELMSSKIQGMSVEQISAIAFRQLQVQKLRGKLVV
jgi:hypothetical protein